jgi:L-rhamnose isomerase/sugar isomerase
LKGAYSTDVRPAIREWRKSKGLAEAPLDAFRESGYLERAMRDRAERNRLSVSSYA